MDFLTNLGCKKFSVRKMARKKVCVSKPFLLNKILYNVIQYNWHNVPHKYKTFFMSNTLNFKMCCLSTTCCWNEFVCHKFRLSQKHWTPYFGPRSYYLVYVNLGCEFCCIKSNYLCVNCKLRSAFLLVYLKLNTVPISAYLKALPQMLPA